MPITSNIIPVKSGINVSLIGSAHQIPEVSVEKFGNIFDLAAGATDQDIWSNGGVYTGQPVGSPETVEIFSDSVNDAAAGTGALTVTIQGLKNSTSEVYEEETLTLNGVTPVASVNTWWRVNRALVATAGSGNENDGTLTIRHTTTTANVFATIEPGDNQTLIAAFTIPANRTGIFTQRELGISRTNGQNGSARISVLARPSGGVYRPLVKLETTTGAATARTYQQGLILEAGTDVLYRSPERSDNNTSIYASFNIILYK